MILSPKQVVVLCGNVSGEVRYRCNMMCVTSMKRKSCPSVADVPSETENKG